MEKKIVIALDGLDINVCMDLVRKIRDRVFAFKIHDLWDTHGPSVVSRFVNSGTEVFVDFKLHDIPNTVKLRAKAVAKSGASILTVHASGGIDMMKAAVEGAGADLKILAITILTSLGEEDAHLIYGEPTKAGVLNFARMAKLAGVWGIVCSPQEVGILAKRPELQGLKFVTPGVRSPGKDVQDQKRVDTPAAAIKAGADFLVVGREVVQAEDPVAALENIERQIAEALAERS